MIVLTLEIAAIAILLIAAATAYVFKQAARAPKGFENLDGFHFGSESRPQSVPTPGRAHRRKRAAVLDVVSPNASTMPGPIHHGPPAEA